MARKTATAARKKSPTITSRIFGPPRRRIFFSAPMCSLDNGSLVASLMFPLSCFSSSSDGAQCVKHGFSRGETRRQQPAEHTHHQGKSDSLGHHQRRDAKLKRDLRKRRLAERAR